MSLSSGIPRNARTHAKNYQHKEVQARLDEAVKPMQQMGLNALQVDSHEVYVYLKNMSSRVCTCKQVQTVVTEQDLEDDSPVKPIGIAQTEEVSINWGRPLFGESHEAHLQSNDESLDDEDDPYEIDEDAQQPLVQSSVIESSPDCGICYKSGFVPGFTQYGKSRFVLTTHDLIDQNALSINRSVAPHVIDRLAATGWAMFQMQVPKYFKSVTYSVRNSYDILNEQLWTHDDIATQLSLAYLKANAGRLITFKVRARQFTHVVVTFDLGTNPILANIAQLSKVTDWTMFETIGNLNVILPMTIPELPVGSVLILPSSSMGMRIVDVPQLRTAKGHNIDWACNTRVMQPQEQLKSIAKGFRMF